MDGGQFFSLKLTVSPFAALMGGSDRRVTGPSEAQLDGESRSVEAGRIVPVAFFGEVAIDSIECSSCYRIQ
jgi:hypothetical protein